MHSRSAGVILVLLGALLGCPGPCHSAFGADAPPSPAQPAGSAESDADAVAVAGASGVHDPLERMNRVVFALNDGLYKLAARPVARAYEATTPRPVRRGLENFFRNLRYPVRLAGAVLQGKARRALRETGRFVVNTVGGLGGFVDVAATVRALQPEPAEDFGQTFGRWSVPPGAYLVVPLLGPTSARDLVGRVGDTALTPTYWSFGPYDDWEWHLGVQATDAITDTPALLAEYDWVRSGAIDPYAAMRDAYLARRAAEITR